MPGEMGMVFRAGPKVISINRDGPGYFRMVGRSFGYARWGRAAPPGRLDAKQKDYLAERKGRTDERIDMMIARIDRILGR